MSLVGTVNRWYFDRGYGFISPDNGGQDLLFHKSEITTRFNPYQVTFYQIAFDTHEWHESYFFFFVFFLLSFDVFTKKKYK